MSMRCITPAWRTCYCCRIFEGMPVEHAGSARGHTLLSPWHTGMKVLLMLDSLVPGMQ